MYRLKLAEYLEALVFKLKAAKHFTSDQAQRVSSKLYINDHKLISDTGNGCPINAPYTPKTYTGTLNFMIAGLERPGKSPLPIVENPNFRHTWITLRTTCDLYMWLHHQIEYLEWIYANLETALYDMQQMEELLGQISLAIDWCSGVFRKQMADSISFMTT